MKIGIVILNYNSYNLSCELVKKCIQINLINKIVLIDNNSKDNFDSFVNDLDNTKVKYIKNNVNSGYAAGNNIGLKFLYEEGYDVGFVANPDVIFDYNTINEISNFIYKNNEYALVSSMRTQNGTQKTAQFWEIPKFTDSLIESVFLGRKILGNYFKNKSNKICDNCKSNYIDVQVVGGAFFACNLEIMAKINYFDENTFLWYEENILAYKIKQENYKEAILTTCKYEHNHKKNGRGNKLHSVFVTSKRHYCYNYLKINIIQKVLLFLFDFVGAIENNIICLLFNRG